MIDQFGDNAHVGLVSFHSTAKIEDMNPFLSGIQETTLATADADGNSQLDVDEALKALRITGATNFKLALQAGIDLITNSGFTPSETNVIFISDGFSSGTFTNEINTIRSLADNVRAFGAGSGASLTQLQQIDPGAVRFTSTDELLDIFAGTGDSVVFTEPGLDGWTIQLVDRNTGEVVAETVTMSMEMDGQPGIDPFSESGFFWFNNVPNGNFRVREVLQTGWTQSRPVSNPPSAQTLEVLAATGADIAEGDFFTVTERTGTFSINFVFDKPGGATVGGGDVAINITDGMNRDQIVTAIVSALDGAGQAQIDGIDLGGGYLQIGNAIELDVNATGVSSADLRSLLLGRGTRDVDVTASQQTISLGKDTFGNFELATISGVKFDDLDGDGVKDAGEPGLPGWTIYDDINQNNVLDVGELRSTTDANGAYAIQVGAGNHHVREAQQAGWTQTTANPAPITPTAGQQIPGINFGNFRDAVVSGIKFDDVNGNGVKNGGETGLGGWTIFDDDNGNGVLDTGEASTTTNGSGSYSFTVGPNTTLTLREVGQVGWTQTTLNPVNITPTSGQNVGNVDFGNYLNATVGGIKFNDLNGDGAKDAGEPGLAGWTIFDDDNANGVLDTGEANTVTGAGGNYSFTVGPNKTLTLREVAQSGWTQTTLNPAALTPTSGQNVANVHFGNFQDATVSGIKFNDLNGNGVKDGGDAGLPGWTIFDDDNGNGVLDTGEASTTTNGSGSYSFTVGPNKTLTLREVAQAGWTQTTANPANITATSGQAVINVDFGNYQNATVSGIKFEDVNGNGAKDAGEPGLAGWTIFDDDNGNGSLDTGEANVVTGAGGSYSFTVGPNKTLTLREVGQAGWSRTTGNPGDITPTSGQTVADVDFGNFQSAVVSGIKFEDLNGNGAKDVGEPGLAGWTIFDDDNGNGSLDGGEANMVTGVGGSYSFTVGPNTTLTLREATQAGWTLTTGNPANITPNSGQTVSNVDFGNFKNVTVSGVKFNDLNSNGAKDAGEPGLAGWTIFDDDNGNGVLDTGEANTTTAAGGSYSFTVGPNTTLTLREVGQANWTQTTGNPVNITPTSGQVFANIDFGNFQTAAVAGVKFDDLNGNGVKDGGEPGLAGWTIFDDDNGNGVLDGIEASTVTGAGGSYSFMAGPNTTITLREVAQAGWTQTTTNPAPITPTSGQVVGNVDFGNFKLISISGKKFNDLNANGTREGGEQGLPGWTIFLDTNNNGSLDTGEANAVTDGNGDYSFSNLGPGTYRVREVSQANFSQSTAAIDIVASSGTNVTNADLGNVEGAVIKGTKFVDVNGNGTRDTGDNGLPGWTIFLDTNGNGTLDGGEVSDTTDSNGDYEFAPLTAGTYRVREVPQAGWVQTTTNPPDAVIGSGTVVTEDFGNFKLGSITVVKDADPDTGTDFSFTGTFTTFSLDDDTENTLPNSKTFPNLNAGTYTITEGVVGGWELTNIIASDGSTVDVPTRTATITVSSGENITVTFINEVTPAFRGIKFFDHDGQGDKDAGDEGLANWRIELFQDDGDGIFEPGPFGIQVPDPVGTTGGDQMVDWDLTDALGNFRLGEPTFPTGTYFIREIQQQGWGQTTPAGTSTNELVHVVNYTTGNSVTTGIDFGNQRCNELTASGAQTLSVTGTKVGILTIVFPTSFTAVDSSGFSFKSYDGAGSLVTGTSAVTSYLDSASGLYRVDIKIENVGATFNVAVGAAGMLRHVNALNVDTTGGLALQINGTECGDFIVVGDDNNDDGTERGTASDAKAIFIGTHSEPISNGTVLSATGIIYRTTIIDAIFGQPAIARVDINGFGGDDVIRVTADVTTQQSTLAGGSGNDTIYGGGGKSTMSGDNGHDLLVGGAADDVINGGGGDDAIFGGRGSDRIFGGDGNDWIAGGADNDPLLRGGNGDDLVSGGPGQDRLLGDNGIDTLYRDGGDLLVSGEIINTVPPAVDVVDQALLTLLARIWNDRFSKDGVDNDRDGLLDAVDASEIDEDSVLDTLDELIANILPSPQP
ncbi:MAG: hypothetical protein O3C40_00530 [Planctomycetota bacterium]|nr:hypothetical protein [Planctomycetota bacterium]